jgi:hypothetical protein
MKRRETPGPTDLARVLDKVHPVSIAVREKQSALSFSGIDGVGLVSGQKEHVRGQSLSQACFSLGDLATATASRASEGAT